ncbi:stomatin-like [Sycon ciliatum]|uniref:stomatin-like n=1 Tax=Sycon ciliatum TaxID=27933 RepID=UPI0031F5F40C
MMVETTCDETGVLKGRPSIAGGPSEPQVRTVAQGEAEIGRTIATAFSILLCIFLFPISLLAIVKLVNEYTRVVIMRLGRVVSGDAKGPGLFFVLPCIDDLRNIDLRTQVSDVPPQEILTKDHVTVTVDGVLFYRIFQPVMSVTNVANAQYSTWLLAQTTLRNILGTVTLEELISNREEISRRMQVILDEATDPWGVKVERIDVKDVKMPKKLQRAMAAEAEAARDARAKAITAEGEQRASRALKEAANVLTRSPGAMQLRYLQTLQAVSADNNHTVVFPLPNDLVNRVVGAFAGAGRGGPGLDMAAAAAAVQPLIQ